MSNETKYTLSLAFVMEPAPEATLDEAHFFAVSDLFMESHDAGMNDVCAISKKMKGFWKFFSLSGSSEDRRVIHVNSGAFNSHLHTYTFHEVAKFEKLYVKVIVSAINESGRLPQGVALIHGLLHIQPWWDNQLPKGWHVFPMTVPRPRQQLINS